MVNFYIFLEEADFFFVEASGWKADKRHLQIECANSQYISTSKNFRISLGQVW